MPARAKKKPAKSTETSRPRRGRPPKQRVVQHVSPRPPARPAQDSGLDRVLVYILSWIVTLVKFVIVFSLGAIVTAIAIGVIVSFLYARQIAQHSGVSIPQLVATVVDARSARISQTNDRKNILVLGIDSLSNRDSETVLTDTIMVVSIGLARADIKTFSYPRDLYIASQSAKINALYEKGKSQNSRMQSQDGPRDDAWLIRSTIQDISGLPIHHVMTLDIATVGEIIDAFGGLEIEIERSFVDYQYPRSDVDVRVVRDPAKLYEVVAFTQGKEVMTGDRAIRYIRSRKSPDPVEGTDDARVRRQQRVIAALLTKLKDPTLARNPEQLGKLLAIYNRHVASSLPLTQVGAMAWTIIQHHQTPQFVSYQFPIQANGTKGLLYHPERHPSGAWVYLPVDPTYAEMQKTVQGWINE